MSSERRKMMDSMEQVITKNGSKGWDMIYKSDQAIWDIGHPTPALRNLLKTGLIPEGLGFVPGCGVGHDVFLLANEKRRVIGMDISETCKQLFLNEKNRLKSENCDIVLGDFFKYKPDSKYDFVFDYTFLCAIPVERRTEWAEWMAKYIRKDGILISLIFPIAEYEGGPPFSLLPSMVEALLKDNFTLVLLEDCESIPVRQGREKISVWKRK